MNEFLNILNIVFAIVFILFLPGHLITYIFFPLKKIDLIERTALSFALSIAIVPLFVFYMNLLGIPITRLTVTYQILFLVSIALIVLLVKLFKKHHEKK